MKKILLLIVLLLIPSIYAYDECKGVINTNSLPCKLLLPALSTTDCATINISYYNETTYLSNATMTRYNLIYCYVNFTQTKYGTYSYYFTTGDSGSIIVEEDKNNSYYLYIVSLIVFVILIALGYWKEEVTFITLGGMLLCAIAINLWLNGFPNLTNDFLKNGIALVIGALGAFLIVAPYVDELERYF